MGVDAPPPLAALLPVGVLGRPHGIRGELSLRPYAPGSAERLLGTWKTLWIETSQGLERHAVTRARAGGESWLVRLGGIESRDAAARLTNSRVLVERATLPPLAEGEFYVADVLGLGVRDQRGVSLGRVKSTFWNGAQDIAVVEAPEGRETLLPLVGAVVQRVDLAQGLMTVEWQLDDEEPEPEQPSEEASR